MVSVVASTPTERAEACHARNECVKVTDYAKQVFWREGKIHQARLRMFYLTVKGDLRVYCSVYVWGAIMTLFGDCFCKLVSR